RSPSVSSCAGHQPSNSRKWLQIIKIMSIPTNTPAAAVESAKHDAVVQLRGVNRRFKTPTGQVVTALQGIEFDIYPGEFVSLIGPSGCGKSTLLRIVADLLQPSDGTVTINGKSAHDARLARDYGIVFQTPVLYDWRSVLKNIELPLEIMKQAPAAR